MTKDEVELMVNFLLIARSAWGSDHEYARLWGSLNLTICMWLFRRLVVQQADGLKRHVSLTREQFKKCLTALSASNDYLDWLVGRSINDRDRAPCLNRIKSIFAARLQVDTGTRPKLPQPAWASS